MFGRFHLWCCPILKFYFGGIFWLLIQFHEWELVCLYVLFLLIQSEEINAHFMSIYLFICYVILCISMLCDPLHFYGVDVTSLFKIFIWAVFFFSRWVWLKIYQFCLFFLRISSQFHWSFLLCFRLYLIYFCSELYILLVSINLGFCVFSFFLKLFKKNQFYALFS